MATYEIRIIKKTENTKFDEEMAAFDERYPKRNMYNDEFDKRTFHPEYPRRHVVADSLMTELSDEQYKKVKAEVIKVFE